MDGGTGIRSVRDKHFADRGGQRDGGRCSEDEADWINIMVLVKNNNKCKTSNVDPLCVLMKHVLA